MAVILVAGIAGAFSCVAPNDAALVLRDDGAAGPADASRAPGGEDGGEAAGGAGGHAANAGTDGGLDGDGGAACAASESRCDDRVPMACGADGRWVAAMTCAQACLAGACVECSPGATMCASTTALRTCSSEGAWGPEQVCLGAACKNNKCGGACQPDTKACDGRLLKTCGQDGEYDSGTMCPNACVTNACGGICTPGSKRCSPTGAAGIQTCDSNGQWGSAVACSGGTPECAAGVCVCSQTTCGNNCVNVSGSDANHCGRCGRSCLGGTCATGVCSVVQIGTSGLQTAYSIGVSDNYLYWSSKESPDYIRKLSLESGVASFASEVNQPGYFVIDGPWLYLTRPPNSGASEIGRTPVVGGTYQKLANADLPIVLVLRTNPNNVFAAAALSRTYFNSYPKNAPGSSAQVFSDLGAGVEDFEVDGTHLYYIRGNDIVRVGLAPGSAPEIVVTLPGSEVAKDIALDGATLYFVSSSRVGKVPASGGGTTMLAPRRGDSLQIDATNVYWFSPTTEANCPTATELLRVPKVGGATERLASEPSCPGTLVAQDAVGVYWAGAAGTSTVARKVAK